MTPLEEQAEKDWEAYVEFQPWLKEWLEDNPHIATEIRKVEQTTFTYHAHVFGRRLAEVFRVLDQEAERIARLLGIDSQRP